MCKGLRIAVYGLLADVEAQLVPRFQFRLQHAMFSVSARRICIELVENSLDLSSGCVRNTLLSFAPLSRVLNGASVRAVLPPR